MQSGIVTGVGHSVPQGALGVLDCCEELLLTGGTVVNPLSAASYSPIFPCEVFMDGTSPSYGNELSQTPSVSKQ